MTPPRLLPLVALVCAGCAAARPPEVSHLMRLAPRPASATPSPGGVGAVALTISAQGITAATRYVYVDRSEPAELKQAATLMWERPPVAVLEGAVRAALGPAAVTPRVAEAAGEQGRRLDVRLTRFEEATGGGEDAAATVAADATLFDAAARRTVFLHAYCARAPIAGGSPTQRAHAFEIALSELAGRLAQDALAGAPSGRAC